MRRAFPTDKFEDKKTPFYYYDTDLLRKTLQTICEEAGRHEGFVVHYALKANANLALLNIISSAGLGADCVSGEEIEVASETGFPVEKIVFAGVGKSDEEIRIGIKFGIFCFNVESPEELEIINELAKEKGKVANVAFRINPDIGAHTHANITTGLAENKFGIYMSDMTTMIRKAAGLSNVKCIGLHFHIGSQILDMDDFTALCKRINDLQTELDANGLSVEHINVGGGLGVDYENPDANPIPDFKSYFDVYATHLQLRPGQKVHFELGRSVVAQCGSLISRTLYIKHGKQKQFAIIDAGMIENISVPADTPEETYDVVGPICESSDVFAKQTKLASTRRGHLIAIRSAGAYGEIMASGYNCRPLPKGYTSDEIGA